MLRRLKAIASKLLRRNVAARLPYNSPVPFEEKLIVLLSEKGVMSDKDTVAWLNPPKSVQEAFVGTSFKATYWEAADFLTYMFAHVLSSRDPATLKDARILDFGCGWGRMLRLLSAHDGLKGANLYGCDPLSHALETCRRSVPRVSFTRTQPFPPSDYRDDLFDVIYAYSVFSHLSSECHLAWAAEFSRILKPDGYVCMTTQARDFIRICREYRDGTRKRKSIWHENLAKSFPDADCEKRYDAGELLFQGTGGGDALDKSYYGEAIVPKQFFEDNWGKLGFRLVDWYEHPYSHAGAQNRIVLQLRDTVGGDTG